MFPCLDSQLGHFYEAGRYKVLRKSSARDCSTPVKMGCNVRFILQADSAGTIVEFIAENKTSVAPGQVSQPCFVALSLGNVRSEA